MISRTPLGTGVAFFIGERSRESVMRNLKSVFSVLVLVALTSACGNMAGSTNPNSINTSNSYGNGSYSNLGNTGWTAAQQCSENANIIEQGYSNHTLDFQACSGGTNAIKIFPADGGSRSVCVFPLHDVNYQTAPYTKSGQYYNYADQFVYQCFNTNAQGASASFGVSFNSVYVVDAADLQTFGACLAYGTLASCASQTGISYAYGRF